MIVDDIYRLLESADMTRIEIAKTLNVTEQKIVNGMTTATFRFPDLYSYEVKKGKRIVEVYGRLCNYDDRRTT